MKNQYVIGLMWHEADSWYGQNYRLIYRGDDGKGFKTKGEARKHATMLKRYIKNKWEASPSTIEVNQYDKMETYRYMGSGPSWSCNNIEISIRDYINFREREERRLKEQREERARELIFRENWKQGKEERDLRKKYYQSNHKNN